MKRTARSLTRRLVVIAALSTTSGALAQTHPLTTCLSCAQARGLVAT
jgi:hypothetical protein